MNQPWPFLLEEPNKTYFATDVSGPFLCLSSISELFETLDGQVRNLPCVQKRQARKPLPGHSFIVKSVSCLGMFSAGEMGAECWRFFGESQGSKDSKKRHGTVCRLELNSLIQQELVSGKCPMLTSNRGL